MYREALEFGEFLVTGGLLVYLIKVVRDIDRRAIRNEAKLNIIMEKNDMPQSNDLYPDGGREPPNLFDEWDDPAATATGVFDGFRRVNPKPNEERYTARNPYYYQAGYVLGYVVKILIIIGLVLVVGPEKAFELV